MTDLAALDHERVVIARGRRSGLTLIIAIHSTTLGSAVGGCRMWSYEDWLHGLDDVLRLSRAMTFKCAAAGIRHGGGKSVILVPSGARVAPDQRVAVMEDLGEEVERLGGQYLVGEDVGTTLEDMLVVRRHTDFASGRPGFDTPRPDLPEPTSLGVREAIRATVEHLYGSPDLADRRITVVGQGAVGASLTRLLRADGAQVGVTDIDTEKRAPAEALGATWLDPADALLQPADVVVPAALGGVITPEVVDRLQCKAIVGPANNQLTDDTVADLLDRRGIVWAPDFIVNAGGVIWAVGRQLDGLDVDAALDAVRAVGQRVAGVLDAAAASGTTTLQVAQSQAADALAGAA
jgi:leucine dehydrogenase